MLNDNKDFIIVILLVALTCAVTQIFLINNQRKNASLPEKKEIKRVEFKVDKSLSNRTKPGTEIFKDFPERMRQPDPVCPSAKFLPILFLQAQTIPR